MLRYVRTLGARGDGCSADEKSPVNQRILPLRGRNGRVFLFPQSGYGEIDLPRGDRQFGSESTSFNKSFEKANALLDGKNSTASKFGEIRNYEDSDIVTWEPQLTISNVFEIRTFWDLQQNQQKHGEEERQEKMLQLEMRVSQIPEYRDIAFFHHLLLKKS